MAVDYSVLFDQPSIGQRVRSGIQTGMALRAAQEEKQRIEEAKLQKQQFEADLTSLRDDWSPDAANDFILKYPSMTQAITAYGQSLNDRQKQAKANAITQVFSAAQAGNYDLVEGLLNRRLEAAANSNDQAEIDATNVMLSNLKMDPESVRESSYIMLASLYGPEEAKKIADGLAVVGAENRARELQSFAVTEQEAKAAEAAVKSRFAEVTAITDIVQKGGDASALITDPKMQRYNNELIVKRNQKEAAERKQDTQQALKLEMEIADIEAKRDEAAQKKVVDAENAQAGTQLTLDTIARIRELGGTKFDVFGRTVAEASTGPLEGRLPGLNESVVDFQSLIETLKSQAFLENVEMMKGTGSLTETEGKKLENRIASLNLTQSSEMLMKNIGLIEAEFRAALERSKNQYGNLVGQPVEEVAETATEEVAKPQPKARILRVRPAGG